MERERFSLLLLDPGEIYFEDFYVTLKDSKPSGNEIECLGHLKMCSKSLVFDPKDKLQPLIKIPYKDCLSIDELEDTLQNNERNILQIKTQQYIEMLEGNILAPYKFRLENRVFLFRFHYGKVSEYLTEICQLHRASSLHVCDQNNMIAAIVYSKYKRIKFNPLWLDDIYEKIVVENCVEEINPLVVNPGRVVLSSCAIYFQSYNNINAYPVRKIKLKLINHIIKRRFLLRHIGLEIKWNFDNKEHLLYIAFKNQNERDTFYEKVMEQDELSLQTPEPETMTLKWQNGVISNYEYLLYLNSLADRSFQDLTQYPVFPWVISDYTSAKLDLSDISIYRDLKKPIGALNEERFMRLKERCDEMDNPKFLYGSHYSAPGLVLFYLVRKYPNLMLCLQNGRFDHPDRMFNKVEDTFNNCLKNMSDFKELIPEFYDTSNDGDFLINSKNIEFGLKFDSTVVHDVILPPWANGSSKMFIESLREALESDYVTNNLNYWIDLIFGYKQRGEEALKANNLFYHLCYEGSVDLNNVSDLAAKHALEVQISEFGQIPKQLFTTPHVPKIPVTSLMTQRRSLVYNNCIQNVISDSFELSFTNLKLLSEFSAYKDLIRSTILDSNNIITTGNDGILKCFDIEGKKQVRSVSISSLPISSCIKIPDSNLILLGSWDNTIIMYNLDYGKISNVTQAHDDAVSCLSYIDEVGILISGSWDCSVKIWKGFDKVNCLNPIRPIDSIIAYLSLEEKIICLSSCFLDKIIKIIIGTSSGELLLWDTVRIDGHKIKQINVSKVMGHHEDEVTAVSFNLAGTKLVSCGKDKLILVMDVETGMVLFKKYFDNPLTCLNWQRLDELLFLGDNAGELYIWDVVTGKIVYKKLLHKANLSIITMSSDNTKVLTAGKDNNDYYVKVWEF